MSRKQYTDCYDFDVRTMNANAADDGVTNGASFDTQLCNAPSFAVKVASLAQNKKIAFKIQHSSDNAAWVDVPAGLQTDAKEADEIEANGNHKYYYAGEKRYIRLVVISKSAAPDAVITYVPMQNLLLSKPNNAAV